jgi:hypothetical protein
MTARRPATPLSYLFKNDRKKASYPAELSVQKWPQKGQLPLLQKASLFNVLE